MRCQESENLQVTTLQEVTPQFEKPGEREIKVFPRAAAISKEIASRYRQVNDIFIQ